MTEYQAQCLGNAQKCFTVWERVGLDYYLQESWYWLLEAYL